MHFGQSAAAFGGGRGHRGQDVFAGCGAPVRAARDGVVVDNRFDGAGGHYLVVEGFGGRAVWTAPGWFEGGEAVDPLPFLRSAQDR